MKSIFDIAKMLGLRWSTVDNVVKEYTPALYCGKRKLFNDFQVDLICKHFYLTKQADFLILE